MRGYLLVILVLLAFIVPAAFSQDTTGNLEGFVLDAEGVPIGGAKIVISGPSLQGTRESATDERGRFLALSLPAGPCTARIVHPAYREVSFQAVTIRLGRTTSLGEIRLQPKVSEEREVVVFGDRPIIDRASAAGGDNLEAKTFETLPVERTYRDLALLLPNASQSFLGDLGVNISGATGLENKYFIDGVEVTDPARGTTGTNLPFNFIKEFELRTGSYEPEYRSSLGGAINVITYSGGNEFSGRVFGFFSNDRFAGSPRLGELEPPKGGFSQYDLGLSFGGPIVRDRLWFFLAYDPTFEREDVTIPGLGFFPDKNTTHIFAGKLTWQASTKTSLVFTTIGDPSRRSAVGVFTGVYTLPQSVLNPDPYLSEVRTGGIDVSLKGTHVFNENFFIEAILSQLSARDNLLPDTDIGWTEPLFIDAENGIWSGGAASFAKFLSLERALSLKGTLSLANHLIKSGLEYRDNKLDLTWTGQQLTRYGESYYEYFQGNLGGTYHNRMPSLFIQDSWGIGRRFQANLGLRWDGQLLVASNGKVAQKILGQYQPRIGLIYEPGRPGTQKIFSSFGRFYQEVSLFAVSNYFTQEYVWYVTSYDHDPRIDPTGGETFQMIPGIQPENTGLEGQHYDEFTLGYERLLGRNLKIGVRGIYRTLRQAVEDSIDLETDPLQYFWGNPGKGHLTEYPRPRREYAALELTFNRPAGPRFSFHASYVLSRTFGNYGGLFTPSWGIAPNMTNQYDWPELLINGTGLLPNDRTHVLKFFGTYRLPWGLNFGTSIIWESGTPLSELGGSSAGGMWNSFISQRGTAGRTPAIFDLNFRIVYDLSRIMNTKWTQRITLDLFHVTSQRSPVTFDQVRYFNIDESGNQINPNPTYGHATSYFPPMSARLGFEVGF